MSDEVTTMMSSQEPNGETNGESVKDAVTLPIRIDPDLAELVRSYSVAREAMFKRMDEMHDEVWSRIHDRYPDLPREENHTLDTKYMDQGIVMLTSDECDLCEKLAKRVSGLSGGSGKIDFPEGLKTLFATMMGSLTRK